MKHTTISQIIVSASFAFTVLTLQAQPTYTITDAGVLPGTSQSQAWSINDNAVVVGHCVASATDQTGFAWSDGIISSIGKLKGGHYSYATSINSHGQIAGFGDAGSFNPQPLLYRDGTLLNISPSSDSNFPFYINDAGVIVGNVGKGGSSGSSIPVIWTEDVSKPGRFRSVSLAPFPGDTQAYASGANQSIQVVGQTSAQFTGTRGVFWNNDAKHTAALLRPLPNENSVAYGVNDLGIAVGYSWYGIYHSTPMVWGSDAFHTPVALPLLPGDNQGSAQAINNYGEIIGHSRAAFDINTGRTPVIWLNGQVFNLQALLDASGLEWQLADVTSINNLGEIVGRGVHNGQIRAFLLTPLP
jgi:uncharacterized membrane protein